MKKYSVTIRGHRTSYTLEQAFAEELAKLAESRGMAVARLVAEIDAMRSEGANLASAIRLHVLEALRGVSSALVSEDS